MSQVELNYIGACFLLARISNHSILTAEDKQCVKSALEDFLKLYPDRFKLVETSGGGVYMDVQNRPAFYISPSTDGY